MDIDVNYLIKNTNSIFDVVALCAKMIFNEQNIYNDSKEMQDVIYNDTNDIVDEYCLKKELGSDIFANLYQDVIEIYIKYNSKYVFKAILDHICEKISYYYYDHDEYSEYNDGVLIALNHNYKITGLVVMPIKGNNFISSLNKKMNLKKEVRGLRKMSTSFDNEYLKKGHYIIYKKDLFEQDVQIYIKRNLMDLNEKKEVLITLSPFISSKLENYILMKENREKFWFTEYIGLSIEDSYLNRYETCLNDLKKNRADIIIFPELIFSDLLRDEIIEMMSRIRNENDCLIVAGSHSINGENHCYIYDNYGENLFIQEKRNPFLYKGKLKEKLVTGKYPVSILEIENFGRILVCICKDINDSLIHKIIEMFEIQLVIISAYSSSNDLATQAKQITENYNCITILCNACSAYNNFEVSNDLGKEIGFIFTPGIKETKRISKQTTIKITEDCLKCSTYCHSYLIRISDSLSVENSTITCKTETLTI